MKVSIVTTSFNQAPYLERTILSVLEQDYSDIEFIIIDPGSTDGSRDIIERYRKSFTKVLYERDRGPADGLNRAFAYATGEICNYLHSDDMFLPGAVRKAVEAFELHPETDMIYAHGYMVDENGRVLRRLRSNAFNLRRYVYGAVLVAEQATFFRRQALIDVGGFNAETRCGFDGELLVRFARAGKRFCLVNDYWGVFRVHGTSMTGSKSHDREYENLHRRIFREVVGREPNQLDWFGRIGARATKWYLEPVSASLRLMERVAGPRFLRLPPQYTSGTIGPTLHTEGKRN